MTTFLRAVQSGRLPFLSASSIARVSDWFDATHRADMVRWCVDRVNAWGSLSWCDAMNRWGVGGWTLYPICEQDAYGIMLAEHVEVEGGLVLRNGELRRADGEGRGDA